MAATITITATYPDGTPLANAPVKIEHTTGTYVPGHSPSSEILGVRETTLNASGVLAFDVEPCVDALEGTLYRVRCGGKEWRIQPITDDAFAIGDPTIDASGIAPGIQYQAGPAGQDGDLTVDSDLTMPTSTVSGGTATAGSVRNAQALILKDWDYTQTTPPTDVAVGTAVHVPWDVTVSAGAANTATGWFGPRAVFNNEGLARFGVNQTAFTFEPIGFGDLLRVANTAGVARTLIPAWSFLSSRGIIADGAVVSLGQNDTNRGGAAFVNNKFYVSINGGQISDTGNGDSMVGFYDAPVISGNVDIDTRVGFDAREVGIDSAYNAILDSSSGAPPLTGNMDPHGGETLEQQIGFRAQYMNTATSNVGFWNGSAYVAAPQTSTISGASSTIRIDAELVILDNTAGASVTLTGTPIMADGVDGQTVTLFNGHATHSITLSGERAGASFAAVASTNISDFVILGPHATAQMRYNATTAAWHPVSVSQPQSNFTPGGVGIYSTLGDRHPRVSMGTFFTVSFLTMGPGGSTTSDTYLNRLSAGVFGVGTAINGSDGRLIGRVTNPGRTVTADTTLAATDIGGVVVVNSSSGGRTITIPLHASVNTADYDTVKIINRGSSTATIAHAGTLVTGSTTSVAQGKSVVLTRLAENVWVSD
jgi:hypothetical protein